MSLSPNLVRDLRRLNPWWEDLPLPVLPETRRNLVETIHRRLKHNLAPIVVVRGPRQIGKTTAQLHVIQDLLTRGVDPRCIFRVQCDDLPSLMQLEEPILRLVDWYEESVLGQTLNQAAHGGQPTFLFFDEVQNLADWAEQLKSLVDASTTQIVVTGSSALRIERGRDSLAGRINTIEAGVLSLTEIGRFHGLEVGPPFLPDNGLEPIGKVEFWRQLSGHGEAVRSARDAAFAAFSERGGYPLGHKVMDAPWEFLADQLNETVIRRVIQHDLRIGDRGRKRDAVLLEEVFRLCCRYVGQTPSSTLLARECQAALNANIGPQRIDHYLRFLADTLLLRLARPLEIRLKKSRSGSKICLADHALRASWLQEVVPLTVEGLEREPHLTTLAGHIAESVVGTALCGIGGLDVAHLPERKPSPEVDFILTVGTIRIPLEVKYQSRIDPIRDTAGLRSYLDVAVNNAPFGLLITRQFDERLPDKRIIAMPLSTFMLIK
ncbi:MAG TPA: AAA family ATPase [Armatimonadota bacterium]|nr:AAA family ATPase [Armatimonadota bacterium]